MGHLGFWVLLVVSGMVIPASLCFSSSSDGTVPVSAIASSEDVAAMNQGGVTAVINNRKLKESSHGISTTRNKGDLGGVYMEDYPRFDPTPSSKASIKNGPIEHGTPLMPYVPRPTPPGHPRHGSP